jgi:hypothetical protein
MVEVTLCHACTKIALRCERMEQGICREASVSGGEVLVKRQPAFNGNWSMTTLSGIASAS